MFCGSAKMCAAFAHSKENWRRRGAASAIGAHRERQQRRRRWQIKPIKTWSAALERRCQRCVCPPLLGALLRVGPETAVLCIAAAAVQQSACNVAAAAQRSNGKPLSLEWARNASGRSRCRRRQPTQPLLLTLRVAHSSPCGGAHQLSPVQRPLACDSRAAFAWLFLAAATATPPLPPLNVRLRRPQEGAPEPQFFVRRCGRHRSSSGGRRRTCKRSADSNAAYQCTAQV